MNQTAQQTTSTTPLKVITCLKGGIGNQLFQHVFGASLARRLGGELYYDINSFLGYTYHHESALAQIAPQAAVTEVAKHAGAGTYVLSEGLIHSLQDHINLPADARVLVLDGYWQYEQLLDRAVAADTLATIAAGQPEAAQSPLAREIQAQDNAVAIHLRRRDYGHMGTCEESYYAGAIDFILKRCPDARLYVFADEPNYARALLGARYPDITTLVQSGGDVADLFLMSLCKHFVIANSTYSWWPAYFAEGKGGLIICPQQWVTIAGVVSPCPARWIQVPDAVRPMAVDAAKAALTEARIQKTLFDAAIRRWFGDQGDKTLRVNFTDLNADSVVLDLGGYMGDWTHEIHSRYDARLYTFEPIGQFANHIRQRFAGVDAVKVFTFGLGQANERIDLGLSADGTGAFKTGGATETVEIREIKAFLDQEKLTSIDLMKINIEGAEFDLLNHIVDSGVIARIKKIQVQFHDFAPDAIRRREAVTKKLEATHQRTWNYYFVWEEWQLRA